MRPIDEIRFIYDRVMAEIKANPPRGPLLVEHEPTPAPEACARGHVDWFARKDGQRGCRTCRKAYRRAKRQAAKVGA